MRFQKRCSLLFLFGLSVSPAIQADADPLIFVDVYGGYTWSQDQDAKSELPVGGVSGRSILNNLDVHSGPAFGGRIGFWLKTHPSIGIAIDATHFDSDMDRQTVTRVFRLIQRARAEHSASPMFVSAIPWFRSI